jgi:hypothetical protein
MSSVDIYIKDPKLQLHPHTPLSSLANIHSWTANVACDAGPGFESGDGFSFSLLSKKLKIFA